MRHLLTDLRESAGFLADVFRIALIEAARRAHVVPTNGRPGPRDQPEAWTDLAVRRVRPTPETRDARRSRGGNVWFG